MEGFKSLQAEDMENQVIYTDKIAAYNLYYKQTMTLVDKVLSHVDRPRTPPPPAAAAAGGGAAIAAVAAAAALSNHNCGKKIDNTLRPNNLMASTLRS
jgi:hypothetical protein